MSSTYAAGWLRDKPVRPYRNLTDFVSKYQYLTKREWPCLACRGRGWDYDPEDPPCPIEGNRGRNTVPCAACGGSGEGTKTACVQAYREAIKGFKEEADDYKTLFKVRKDLLQGLSKTQIRAIKELGLP